MSVHLSVIKVVDDDRLTESSVSKQSSDYDSAPDKEVLDSNDIETFGKDSKQDNTKLRSASLKFQMIFRDTGVGIAKADLEKLFNNFSKLDQSRKQNTQGVGLGLSICREIIIAHRGTISVESEEGKGTDFIIDLDTKCKYDPNWGTSISDNSSKQSNSSN